MKSTAEKRACPLTAARWFCTLLLAWVVLGSLACWEDNARREPTDVLATIDGSPVTMAEVEELADDELSRLQFDYERKRHQLLEKTLENLVHDRLLEDEAEHHGISKQALLMDALGRVQVTEADVNAWYEQNRARLAQGNKERLFPQIRQLLYQQAQSEARGKLLRRLEEENNVVYILEPFRVKLANDGAPALGPEHAPVTVVEFSDFECPYCKRFSSTLDQIKNDYGDQVRIVFRQFPLQIHANAQKAAEASLCAEEQDRFWDMHDLLFTEQKQLQVTELKEKAGRLGLDTNAFNRCLDSGRYETRVAADLQDGSAAGVSGTPAVFVNGRPVPGGAVPYQTMADVIQDELQRIKSGDN
ncbi:MAG: thioredoxin domain-containing protein [Acidobacteriota bacterium]